MVGQVRMLLAVFSHLLLALLAQLDSMAMLEVRDNGETVLGLTTVSRRGRRACSSRSSATRSSSSLPSSTSQACTDEKAFSALAPRKVLPQPMDWGCFRGFTCSAPPGEAEPCLRGREASVRCCKVMSCHKHSPALLTATGIRAVSAALLIMPHCCLHTV